MSTPACHTERCNRHCSVLRIDKIKKDSKKLNEVQLIVFDRATCQKWLDLANDKADTKLIFCAGTEEGGKDTCDGDSGGPFVCRAEDGTWVQYGLTSHGSRECGRKGTAGVYTNTYAFGDWIRSHIGTVLNRLISCGS